MENNKRYTLQERFSQLSGMKPGAMIAYVGILIIDMGEELWLRFVPKYLEALGATAWGIAVYGTLKEMLDAIFQYPGGWLADRLGRRRALVVFICCSMVGYVIYLISPSWKWALVGTVFAMSWASFAIPAIFAMLGDNTVKEKRSVGFIVHSIIRRIPIIVCPPIGGLLIAYYGLKTGVRVSLGITLVMAVAAIMVMLRIEEKRVEKHRQASAFGIWKYMNRNLKWLFISDCLARLAAFIPAVFVVLYVTNELGISEYKYGLLISLQMVVSILVYIPLVKLAHTMNHKPFILATFVFFALFPLALVMSKGIWLVALAFIIGGLRETGEPARKALIVDLVDESLRGRVVGMYFFARGIILFPSALIGGWLWSIDKKLPFYVAFAIGVAGAVIYAVFEKEGKHTPDNTIDESIDFGARE